MRVYIVLFLVHWAIKFVNHSRRYLAHVVCKATFSLKLKLLYAYTLHTENCLRVKFVSMDDFLSHFQNFTGLWRERTQILLDFFQKMEKRK